MDKIKRVILGLIAAIFVFTAAPISADTNIPSIEPQISSNSNTVLIDQLAAKKKRTVTVYITKTGKKYHTSSCRYLKKSKMAINLSDAKKQGYTACKVCNPPK